VSTLQFKNDPSFGLTPHIRVRVHPLRANWINRKFGKASISSYPPRRPLQLHTGAFLTMSLRPIIGDTFHLSGHPLYVCRSLQGQRQVSDQSNAWRDVMHMSRGGHSEFHLIKDELSYAEDMPEEEVDHIFFDPRMRAIAASMKAQDEGGVRSYMLTYSSNCEDDQ